MSQLVEKRSHHGLEMFALRTARTHGGEYTFLWQAETLEQRREHLETNEEVLCPKILNKTQCSWPTLRAPILALLLLLGLLPRPRPCCMLNKVVVRPTPGSVCEDVRRGYVEYRG